MRTGITVTGIVVLVVGLIVAGVGAYYTNAASEWVGAFITAIGLIAGIAGAVMKRTVAAPSAPSAPSAPAAQ